MRTRSEWINVFMSLMTILIVYIPSAPGGLGDSKFVTRILVIVATLFFQTDGKDEV